MTAMIVADLLPIVVGLYRDFGAFARRDAIPNLHRMSPLVEIRAGVQYRKSPLLVRRPMKIATNIGYFFLIILGVTLLLVSLWLVFPVLVNFPVSWPGALIALLFAVTGVALIYRSWRALRERTAKQSSSARKSS